MVSFIGAAGSLVKGAILGGCSSVVGDSLGAISNRLIRMTQRANPAADRLGECMTATISATMTAHGLMNVAANFTPYGTAIKVGVIAAILINSAWMGSRADLQNQTSNHTFKDVLESALMAGIMTSGGTPLLIYTDYAGPLLWAGSIISFYAGRQSMYNSATS
jgi:hypothetical protein